MTENPIYQVAKVCRCCGAAPLQTIFDFGATPIADRLVAVQEEREDCRVPLTLAFCRQCTACQVLETVSPSILFGDEYPYYSSVSPSLLAHFRKSAEALIEQYDLTGRSLVIEAASNDGYMLRPFSENGIPTLGIDPAAGPVAVARQAGIETIQDFFSTGVASKLCQEGRRADLVLANNVLAHVADVYDFVEAITMVLTEDGRVVIECPYLLDLVDRRAFDTIYHQHLLYFSVTALRGLFETHGLHINDILRTPIHGGSLRVFLSRRPGQSKAVSSILEMERKRRIGTADFYAAFVADIQDMKKACREFLTNERNAGRRVVGYGAAAKATTLLHQFGLFANDLEYIVDKSPWKQGLAMPGTRIPIVAPDRLLIDHPDAVLILAWNFANEIVAENEAFTRAGGRFFVPVPTLVPVTDQSMLASL